MTIPYAATAHDRQVLPDPNIEVISCQVAGTAIRAAMAELGLSQDETARRARITTRHLNRLTAGTHCPSLELAIALSVVLNKPVRELFQVEVKTRSADGHG